MAAFDFPSAPTNGQVFQPPGGPTYVFQSPVWVIQTAAETLAIGQIIMVASSLAPTGYLKANGALVSRTSYAALFAVIGTSWGAGNGSSTFQLPDLRGEFPRFWDDAKGVDASRVFGSSQGDGIKTHTHALSGTSGTVSAWWTHSLSLNTGGESADHTHVASGTTGSNSVGHTHTFSDSSSATGTGSANHTHVTPAYYSPDGQGELDPGAKIFGSQDGSILFNTTTSSSGAAHTHTVAVSGTTGGNSVNHTHTFSDTTTGRSVGHTHLVSGSTGNPSGNHTHSFADTTDGGAGTIAENRPRNIALLACIRY